MNSGERLSRRQITQKGLWIVILILLILEEGVVCRRGSLKGNGRSSTSAAASSTITAPAAAPAGGDGEVSAGWERRGRRGECKEEDVGDGNMAKYLLVALEGVAVILTEDETEDYEATLFGALEAQTKDSDFEVNCVSVVRQEYIDEDGTKVGGDDGDLRSRGRRRQLFYRKGVSTQSVHVWGKCNLLCDDPDDLIFDADGILRRRTTTTKTQTHPQQKQHQHQHQQQQHRHHQQQKRRLSKDKKEKGSKSGKEGKGKGTKSEGTVQEDEEMATGRVQTNEFYDFIREEFDGVEQIIIEQYPNEDDLGTGEASLLPCVFNHYQIFYQEEDPPLNCKDYSDFSCQRFETLPNYISLSSDVKCAPWEIVLNDPDELSQARTGNSSSNGAVGEHSNDYFFFGGP